MRDSEIDGQKIEQFAAYLSLRLLSHKEDQVAPDLTTDNLPETVSREAHQRMTDERNTAREEVKTLGSRLTDMAFTDKARKHFIEKNVDDPEWAADIALPSIKDAGTEISDIGTFLDEKFARLYPTTEALATSSEGEVAVVTDDGVPTPDAAEPPGFARPSPAGDGAPPAKRTYRISDPEVQALIAANDVAGIKALDDAGEIEWYTAAPTSTAG